MFCTKFLHKQAINALLIINTAISEHVSWHADYITKIKSQSYLTSLPSATSDSVALSIAKLKSHRYGPCRRNKADGSILTKLSCPYPLLGVPFLLRVSDIFCLGQMRWFASSVDMRW